MVKLPKALKSSYPRIHVLIARKAKRAVIMRRGPSKQVCSMLWDLKTNHFSVGQWLKGRIYERRSDISPNGKYMIYFAMNGKWNSETKGAWTAISKVPYLKALTLYAKGDCWNGGGLFIDDTCYFLNDRYNSHALIRDEAKLSSKRGVISGIPYINNECLGVYYPRLLRDGWILNADLSSDNIQIFDKKWRNLVLRKFAHVGGGLNSGKSVYWDSHGLYDKDGVFLDFPKWEWADVVERRLAWAEEGKIYSLDNRDVNLSSADFLKDAQLLYDFNGMVFEAKQAPY